MNVLKECPNYKDCTTLYMDSGLEKELFHCDGCTSYKCYELGFMEGAREAVKKINELPESMLRPMTATDLETSSQEYYNNILLRLKGRRN